MNNSASTRLNFAFGRFRLPLTEAPGIDEEHADQIVGTSLEPAGVVLPVLESWASAYLLSRISHRQLPG